MLQQYWLLAALVGAAPIQPQCADIMHVPDKDVAHVPEAGLDPWLDPATAELVTDPVPRVERKVGSQDVKVDIAIPEGLTKPTQPQCDK